MNLKFKILFYFIFIITANSNAQVTQEWVARYNSTTTNSETPVDLALDSSGNIYVTGRDDLGPPGFVTISYDNSGNFRWSTRYVGMQFFVAQPRKVGTDTNNNIYVIATDVSYILIKYDSNGVEQWVRRFGYGSNSGVSDMVIDKYGNVIVTGTVDNDIVTVKYTTNGDTAWISFYDKYYDLAKSMDIDNNGNIAVVGITSEGIGFYEDVLTLKYDSSGALLWDRRFINGKSEYVYDITFDGFGNIISTGFSTDSVWHSEDYFTLKYLDDGTFSWFQEYGKGNEQVEIAAKIEADMDGNIIVTGNGYNTLPYHALFETTVKYNSGGVQQWVYQFRGAHDSTTRVEDLKLDSQGNIYTTGVYNINISGNKRGMYTFKRNNLGNPVWAEYYFLPHSINAGASIELDKNNSVYVTGGSYDTATGVNKIAIIKYSQTSGINSLSGEIPDSYSLSQNYPNPFNPSTKIRFSVSKRELIKIKIYDIQGKLVSTLVNEQKNPGSYEVGFDGEGMPSGVYFYKLEAGEFVQTRRMVLVK